LDEKKNQNTVLSVAKKMCSNNKNIFFIFCGYGTESLNSKISEFNLSKQVFALGYRSDMPDIYNSFDSFYFPSITEGQPLALIESLMYGIPIVASNIEPIKEVIPEELNSQLVNPYDSDSAALHLSSILNGNYPVSKVFLKKWAFEKFCSNVLFEIFYNCL
jgi:glycosyltransferase involved in cell wall biosynthesis